MAIIAGLLGLFLLLTNEANAQKTWDGGASTNNWGDANNWNPDGVPASTDDVSLTGANTINVNVAGVCNNITLNNASLVLTVKSGYSLAVSGNLTVTTGTLNTEASFPTVTGSTTLTAGTVGYTAASGSQTVAVKSYVNLTISGGGTKTLGGTITPSGDLTISGGTLDLSSYTANRSSAGGTLTVSNGATLKIGGTGTLPSNYSTHSIGATSTIEYGGTTQTVATLNSSQNYGHLTISGSSTKTLAAATVVSGNLTISAGTLSTGSNYGMTIGGNWSNAGTFTANSSIVTFNAGTGTQTLNTGSSSFYSLTHSTSGTLQLTTNGLTVTGTFTQSGGIFDANGQAATFTNFVTLSSSTYLASTATQTFNNGLTVSGGTFTGGSGDVDINGGNVTLTSGTFTAPSGTMYVSRDWNHNTGGTFIHNSGTVVFDGSGTYPYVYVVGGSETFYNLKIDKTVGDYVLFATANDKLISTGTLTLSRGWVSATVSVGLEAQGNVTVLNSFGGIDQFVALSFTGTTTQNFDLTGATAKVTGNITVNKASGEVDLLSGLTVAGGKALTITSGTFDLSGYALTLTGGCTVQSGGNLQLQGGETISATPTLNTGSTVTYDGTSVSYTLKNYSYKNLTISGGASTLFALPADLTVAGTLTFTSGMINTGSYSLYLNSTGSVSRTSGHVIGNFKKYITTGATSKTFEVGDTTRYTPVDVAFGNVTVAGDLTAKSTAGDHPNIGSSTVSSTKSVNRYWSLTNSGITFNNYSATFTFVSGDIDGGANTANFIVGKYNAGWTYPTVGTKTSTTTQITGATAFSDFQIGEMVTYSISGNVFEDVNYGGGAGRNKASSSGVSQQYADVELYNSGGVYVSGTNTDVNGDYSFTGLAAGTYFVRVVNDSVRSSRTGWSTSCKPVLTYRTNAASGTAVAVTDYVGGTNPSAADPGKGNSGATFNTTTFVFSAVLSGTAQAVTQCVISSASITGVDFGFNYNTIVNTNNSGQGSLRQAITNMNTLTSDASLAQSGLVAGKDNAVFMISNGTTAAGLRSTNNYFAGGIATISPTSALTTLSTSMILNAQKQPGWTSAPLIELNGTNAGASTRGLDISGGNCVIRGFVINRFGSSGIYVQTNGSNTIAGNYIGTNAAGSAASPNGDDGISLITVTNNTIGGTSAGDGNVISGNNAAVNNSTGIWFNGGSGNVVQGNILGRSADGSTAIPNYLSGVHITSSSNNTIGGTVSGAGNVISGNTGEGIKVSGGTGNAILRNSIYANTTIGIDLNDNGVTANDGTKNAGLPNYDMDHPVFTSAVLSGSTLTFAGYVGSAANQSTFGSAIVEIFKSDNDASGYGEGQTYLGRDTCDANGNFTGSFTVAGLSAGDKITGTATDGSGNTSEFGANFVVNSYSISGTVFEDVTYGGGAGRNKASSSGVGRSGARVELFSGGTFSTSTTTDGSGNYSFFGLVGGNYCVRVVSSSVTSSRTGYTASCLPVMTFKTDTSGGAIVDVTNFVGGHDPSTADAGDAASGWTLTASTGAFGGSGSGKAHAFTCATIGSANVTGVDFGFNFNTVANKNNTGQGSLRQAITNMNTLTGDASLAQVGLVAGKDNAVFMISNGTTAAGLRSANNYFTSGIATITLSSALPTVSTVMVIDAQKQPGWTTTPIIELNGNNGGTTRTCLTLSGGSSVVKGLIINRWTGYGVRLQTSGGNTIAGCYVGLNNTGTSASANSLFGIYINNVPNNTIGGTSATDRNVISGNSDDDIDVTGASATGNLIIGNYVGLDAAGNAAAGSGSEGIVLDGANNNTIGGTTSGHRNVVSGHNNGTYEGVLLTGGASTNTIQGNYVGTNAAGTAAIANTCDGIGIHGGSNNTVGGTTAGAGNLISGNTWSGLYLDASSSGTIIQGNYIGTNAAGTSGLANAYAGVRIDGSSGNTIGGTVAGSANVIAYNGAKGVVDSVSTATGNRILGNAIYSNGAIGIDLKGDGVTVNNGTKNASLPNYDMDYPVFTSAVLSGTTLTFAGYVGSAANQSTFGSAIVEIFKSDNDATGYGEGQTYFGRDTCDANGNFTGSFTVSGLNVGDKITGTATDASNNTSEFGANYTVTSLSISGKVFEDVNYGGGAGRNWTTASGNGGSARSGVRVELFDNAGNFSTSTTTDGSGNYTFTNLSAATYYVRAVSDSVSSSRTGYTTSLKSVMTYRTNASTGTAVAVTDYVGGHDPSTADATRASSGWVLNSTTGAFSGSGSGKASAFSQATISSAAITGVDFGFNFNSIANINDAGQGSLRQVLTNMNTLGGDASLAQSGLVAAKDNAVFMISNGTAAAGLRSSNNYFVSGAATITPASVLPTMTSPMVLDGQKQPGWTSAPIIEIYGGTIFTATDGLTIKGGSSIIRSIIVNGFWNYGIVIDSLGSNTISGCYIGLAPDGMTAKANFSTGLYVKTGSNQIGGTTAGDGNVISGNTGGGIVLTSASATNNLVAGNYIGTSASGTLARGNSSNGITITTSANGNTIGGTLNAAKNVISGNSTGISLSGSGTTNNTILGNFIGTDRSGLVDLGNSANGISITSSAATNTIGGSASGSRNIISGNGTKGITIDGPSTTGNSILGNYVGVDSTGVGSLRNDQDGILISGQANGNTIGGTTPGSGNIIANNGSTGIGLSGTTTTGNKILGNSIYGNTTIGIDLGKNGVTANNGTKSSSLPNYEIDHPVFTSAILSGTTLTFGGYVGSAPSQPTFANVIVEIFKSDNDATGYGEGQTYLGRDTCDANGNFTGSFTVAGLSVADKITGTATDASNNTSEFGANYSVTGIYYSKGSLAVNTASNWNTARDGSGTNASSFGTGNQFVVQNTHAMTLTGSSTWNVSSTGTVQIENGGSWTNSSSGAVTAGTLQVDNGGTYSHGTSNAVPGTTKSFGATSTINYSNAGAQTVETHTYGHLTISGSGTKTLAGTITPSGDLSVNGGTFDLSSYTANRSSGGGTLTVANGATLKIGGTGTLPSNYSTHAIGATSTVEYAGTTTTVAALNSSQNYGNLTISGTGVVTSASFAVATALTVNGSASFIPSAGTITMNNGSSISNSGTLTFRGLTIAASATVTTSSSFSIAGALTAGASAVFNPSGGTITMTGTGWTFSLSTAPTFGGLTIAGTPSAQPGASFSVGGALTVNGSTTLVPTGGTITLNNGASIANSGTLTFYNVTVAASAIVTGSGNFAVAGAFTVNSSGTFTPAAADVISGAGTLTGNGTVKVTRTASTADFSSQYTVTNKTLGNLTVEYAGASAQVISALTYAGLKMNNASGVTMGGDATVNGVLTLTSGNITTSSNRVIISATGSVSRTSGHVVGNFQKYIATGATSATYQIGDASNYTPVDVSFGNVSVAGDLTAKSTPGDHPNIGSSTVSSTKSVNRYWSLTNSGITFTNYSATFTFVSGDIDGGANTANFIVGKYNAGWTYPTVGTKTSTTTQITGATAFSDYQIGEAGYIISGNVFEDVNYGGGAGRSKASSSGVGRQYADVELYNASGVYVSGTNTDASGNYSFTGLSPATYYVRVVNDSVRSSRTGWSTTCKPVLTYRTNAASGTAVAVTDYVGGTDPSATDPGVGSSGATFNTSTFVYSAVLSGTAQAVTQCVIGSASITGVDFGFNFNTIVNTNNTGQGSLRQFIDNANALDESGLAIQGQTAGRDVSIFMVSDGSAHAGLRSGLTNLLTSGVATITVSTSALSTISTSNTIIDGTTQTTNVGNTNSGSVGTGGTVGVDAITLPQYPRPEVAMNAGDFSGIAISGNASNILVKGLAVYNAQTGISISGGAGTGNLIQNVFVGSLPDGTNPGGASRNTGYGISVSSPSTYTIDQCYVTWNGLSGILGVSNSSVLTVTYSEVVGNGWNSGSYEGLDIDGINSTIRYNLSRDNTNSLGTPGPGGGQGLEMGSTGTAGSSNNLVENNTLTGNVTSGATFRNGMNGVTFRKNIVHSNAVGVIVAREGATANANLISMNSIYGNTNLGIDLVAGTGGSPDGVTANNGTTNSALSNSDMDFPVFASAVLNGTTLTFGGYVGSAPNQSTFANAIVEIFKSDDDASTYGEGQTYLGRDTCDASGNFSGSFTVAGLSVGDKITGTATDASNNTSEFGANYTVTAYSISGNVFEDANYGGGAGRSKASSSGVSRSGARVELFDSGGNFSTSTTTDGSGNYTFSGLGAGTYYVRAVSDSVSSSRTGYTTSLKPVMTYRTNAASGTAVSVTDYVGGLDPATADATKAASGWVLNSSTGAFTGSGSGKASAFSQATISSSNITDVDFGFNFNTIVDTNDAGHGSLRQAITNMNTLGGDASLAQSGLVAGIDNAVFMISNGTAAAGLRSANNYFSGGVAMVNVATELPTISAPMVLDAQKQPGWTLAPIIRIDGNDQYFTAALTLSGGSSVVRGLMITRFSNIGIKVSAGGGNTIQGNYIGNTGLAAATISSEAVYLQGTGSNLVGGYTASQRNVIAGVQSSAIYIKSANNTISGNYIGVGADGATTIDATERGFWIDPGNWGTTTIGGATAQHGNVISGTNAEAMQTSGGTYTLVVQNNLIGVDATGTLNRGNFWTGLYIVGDAISGSIVDNVISGTVRGDGLYMYGGLNFTITGNRIGTNAAGTAAIANAMVGITVDGEAGSSVTIGGTTSALRNIISGNGRQGILVSPSSGATVRVLGNHIGANVDNTAAIANGRDGILIDSGNSTTIGGTTADSSNVIRGNGTSGSYAGIAVTGASTVARILGNAIYGNSSIGIDLAANGVTTNDGAKTAGQPNELVDHPVFTSAVLNGTTLTFGGYVGSAPNQSTFANAIVEIFKSDDDASGYGEGQTYLGRDTCDASGNFSGSFDVNGIGLVIGNKITGTATDPSNNTSEFGANYTISVTYYSKGSLAVNTAGNWNTARNGSGTDASSFGTGNIFIIQNTHAMTLTGSSTWDVSASGTVQVENGGSWTNSSSGAVTAGTLQLDNDGAYAHGTNNALPGTSKSFGVTSRVSYYGTTQTVEALTYGHLTIASAGTRTLGGNTTVAGDLTISGGTLDMSSYTANRSSGGGTFTVSNGATLKIGGTNTIPSNYTTHVVGATSTIEYSGTNQSIASLNSSQNYGHLRLSGSGAKTPAAGLTVVGNLTINAGPTFSAGSYTHTVQGNWSNSGTFTAGTSTVQFTGSDDAALTGATTFNTLTVNKSSGTNTLTLNNNVSTATLTMTQGKIVTGSNAVTVTSDRTGNGLVIGTITRTHTFSASTAYAFEGPYNTLTFASGGTLPTSVTVTTTLSNPGANGSMEPIDRYYTISQTGGSGFSYTLRLHYEDTEVSSPNSETTPPLKIWRRTASGPDVWTREGATSNSTTDNWVEMTGLATVGTYSLSSRTVGTVQLTLAQNKTNPVPGEAVTYTLTYHNTGDGSSTSTVITAHAPTLTTYSTGTVVLNGLPKTDVSDADEVTVSGSTIMVNLGTVAAGAQGTVEYRVVIN